MPVKKLPSDSSEFKELGIKLIALSVFALLLVALAVFSNAKPPTTKKAPPESEEVLGGTAQKQKDPMEDLQSLGESAQKETVQAVQGAQSIAQNVLGAASQNATSFVVENTGNALLNQIEKLPEKQQEELKQQICK